MTIIYIILYFIFVYYQWYICMNSCANSYWKGKGKRGNLGISNYNTIKEMGLFWCILPIIGFITTYSFITINEKIQWKKFTLKHIPEAWHK